MKIRRIIVVMSLVLILALVLALHIIEITGGDLVRLITIEGDKIIETRTYYEYKIANWFGIDVSLNFLYDLVLYLILGLLVICIFLILLDEKKDNSS